MFAKIKSTASAAMNAAIGKVKSVFKKEEKTPEESLSEESATPSEELEMKKTLQFKRKTYEYKMKID
jgi:hypothetical protein